MDLQGQNPRNLSGTSQILRAQVSSVTAQIIATATATAIQWTTVSYDNGNFWHPNAPSRFTIKRRGIYVWGGGFQWDVGGAGNYRYLYLAHYRNGVLDSTGINTIGANGLIPSGTSGLPNRHPNVISPAMQMYPGDYVQLEALQDSGGNRNFDNGSMFIYSLELL